MTVVFAILVMGFLIFLMSGTSGLFSHTIDLYCYVDNANGLRTGAPVRLSSVDIGNVRSIHIVNHHDHLGNSTPVELRMQVNAKFQPFLHTDSKVLLSTSGVLGESFVDIDSNHAKGPVAQNNTCSVAASFVSIARAGGNSDSTARRPAACRPAGPARRSGSSRCRNSS